MADDPLKLILELDNQMKGLLPVIDQLKRMGGAADKADQALKKMAEASDGANSTIGKLSFAVGNFVGMAIAQFAALAAEKALEFVTTKLVDMGREMIKTVGEAKRLERSFETLFKPDEAEKLKVALKEISKHTRFDDDRVMEFAVGLKRAGVAAADIPDMLAAGLDMAELSKKPEEALSGVQEFFETLSTRGEIAFRQLANLGIQKPELLKDLAAQTGDSVDEVEKKLTAGKIEISRLTATIYSEMSKHTGKPLLALSVEGSKDIDAEMARLQRQPGEWYKAVAHTPAMDKMAGQIGKFADLLSPEGAVGKKIVGGIGVIIEKVSEIDVEKVIAGITRALEIGGKVFDGIAFGIGVVVEGGKFIIAFFEELWEQTKATMDLFASWGDTLGDLAYEAVQWVSGVLTSIGEFATKAWHAAVDLGTRIWQGIKDGITGGITAVSDAMGALVDGVLGKVSKMLRINSPSLVLMEMGESTGEGYARGIERSQRRVDDAVGDTFNVDATPRTSARALAGAGVTVNVPITVNWTGGGAGDEEEAKRLAERIRDLLPGQLASALEQLSLEMGTA